MLSEPLGQWFRQGTEQTAHHCSVTSEPCLGSLDSWGDRDSWGWNHFSMWLGYWNDFCEVLSNSECSRGTRCKVQGFWPPPKSLHITPTKTPQSHREGHGLILVGEYLDHIAEGMWDGRGCWGHLWKIRLAVICLYSLFHLEHLFLPHNADFLKRPGSCLVGHLPCGSVQLFPDSVIQSGALSLFFFINWKLGLKAWSHSE